MQAALRMCATFLTVALIASCARPTNTPAREPTVIAASATAVSIDPAATPLPATSTEIHSVEQTCSESTGRLVQTELNHADLSRSLPYRVYIPPCAEENLGELPSLYLFHGLARTDSQWDDLGADEIAEFLIASEQAPPFLIVMPWERLGLDFELTILDYLIPHVENEYGASMDPSLRSLGGISRGAGWALRIGLQHPDLFEAIGLHSPAILPPDLFYLPDWIAALTIEQIPDIWIDIGDRDPLRFPLPELTGLFDDAGFDYLLNSFPGEHSEAYWSDHVEEYLRWYVSGWLDLELGEEPQ